MNSGPSASADIPFSRPLKVGQVSARAHTLRLSAEPAELQALAVLWNVLSVESLDAELQVARWKKDGIRINGRVRCTLTQACVVTLEPVPAVIAEDIEQIFVPEGSRLAEGRKDENGELVVEADGPDLPQTFSGDSIDAGELVAEFAALGIDPWPRKEGAAFTEYGPGEDAEEKRPSPFAVLQGWKKREE